VRSDTAEHIAEPGERIDFIQIAGGDEAAQNRHGLSATITAKKRPVIPSDGDAIGRNNWVFLGSDQGGKTLAVLRSFVASCELVKIDPFVWFRDVLGRIATHSIQQLDQLLPHRWTSVRP